jgi:hypothetical protein
MDLINHAANGHAHVAAGDGGHRSDTFTRCSDTGTGGAPPNAMQSLAAAT